LFIFYIDVFVIYFQVKLGRLAEIKEEEDKRAASGLSSGASSGWEYF